MLADAVKYNIRLSFPNKERTDITCNQIVEGSAKFTESVNSQDEFKFGLCESPTFECETVGVGNITGCKIELTYEVYCDANTLGAEFKTDLQQFVFPIRKGVFIVDSSERQADMQHRKIVAYGGGASFEWKLPEYEKIHGWSSIDCNVFSSMLTNFDLKDLKRIDAKATVTKEIAGTRTDTNYAVSRMVRIEFNYLRFAFPLKDTNIYYADFKYKQSADEICQNIIDKANEHYGRNVLDTLEKNTLYEFAEVLKLGNIVSIQNYPPFYLTEDGKYKLTGHSMIIDKEQYLTKYLPDKSDEFYLYIPFSIKVSFLFNISYNVDYEIEESLFNQDEFSIMKIDEQLPSYIIEDTVEHIEKMDLLELFTSGIEILGKIARINNDMSISFINMNKQFYLLPSVDLKPNEKLQPLGVNGASITKSMYSSLWYEEAYTKPYGRIYCEYTNTSGTQSVRNVYLNGFDSNSNANDYLTYSLTSNAIIKENQYTQTEMTEILQSIAESIENVSYVPIKLQCVSIPFIECGDTLEILTQNNDSITTIVMKRTLSGESYVTDEITSV